MKKLQKKTAILFTLLLPVLGMGTSSAQEKKPNVIFILTDDQGWNDAGFAGHPYARTPNLDKFASQSTWFKQFYVASPVCSPSRAAFLTGRFPAVDGVHGHFALPEQNATRSMPNWLDPQVPNVASILKKEGYVTGHFGKWHLGHGPGAPSPEAYGFDAVKSHVSNGPQISEKQKDFGERSTEIIVDETINFIREHKDQPFYVDLWTLLPHAPIHVTPEQIAAYKNLAPNAKDPAFGPWMQKYLAEAKDLKSQMQVYCAALTELDAQLGRLFTALDEMNLAKNTIIVFSSDNGAEDYRIYNAVDSGVGNNGPLRARKRSIYEGGVRTFGLVRWPGHVPAGKADEKSVTGAVDLLPTICKLAGAPLPANVKPDGEDVSDIWLGKPRPRTKTLFWEWMFDVTGGQATGYMPPMLAVRDGDWKLYVNHDGSDAQLFNIPKDISEKHDVAAANPEVVKVLTAKALDWAKSLPPSPTRDKAAATKKPQPENPPRVETVWTGPNGADWSEATNWNNGLPGPDKMARIPAKNGTQIQVKSPATVQAIEINGQGRVELGGESITLGNGAGGSMNSILVAGGEVTINNNLINTQNKRITLGEKAQSLTLKGNIETSGQPTLIGNLGQGALTIHGDRSGGNALVIRDGIVTAFGILSNTGGGVTQVLEKGVLVSSRKQGPTIQQGSSGLALREKGVFRLGAPNQIASFLNFAGGKLEMGGFSNDQPVIGNAALNANSVIDFSNPEAESLTIADVSKNTNWKPGATLQIVGFTQGDSLRFGESANGLTQAQLAAIKFDGKPAKIDADGYVSPSP
jgi:N-acetylgalactosamine-6-sulfatase